MPTVQEDASFEAFFKRLHPRVLRFFLSRGLSPDDARDLAQETFLRAYRGFSVFRGETNTETWVFTIALNLWRNELRYWSARGGRHASARGDEPSPGQEDAGEDEAEDVVGDQSNARVLRFPSQERSTLAALLEKERRALLSEAIDGLPPQMRRCIRMHAYQQLKTSEIATALRVSEQTVRSHISQAKHWLRRELEIPFTGPSGLEP